MRLSSHWNFLIALLPTIGTFGQVFTTHDTRFGIEAVESAYRSIDIAVTDVQRNPDYDPWMRSVAVPALIDTETRQGVTITGTIAQAEADLATAISNAAPATIRERGTDVRSESRAIRARIANERANAGNAGTIITIRPRLIALMEQVERQAELIEHLQERIERLEQKQ